MILFYHEQNQRQPVTYAKTFHFSVKLKITSQTVLKLKLFQLEEICYCCTSLFLQRAERQECNTVNTTKANTPLSAFCQVFSSWLITFLMTVVPPHTGGKVTIRSPERSRDK